MPERLGGIAPLGQWSHDRAMHLGKDLVVQATTAQNQRMTHQESMRVESWYVRRYNISLQRPGEALHGARTRRAGGKPTSAPEALRPAAELGR